MATILHIEYKETSPESDTDQIVILCGIKVVRTGLRTINTEYNVYADMRDGLGLNKTALALHNDITSQIKAFIAGSYGIAIVDTTYVTGGIDGLLT